MTKENDDWLIELAKAVEEEENQLGVVDKDRVEQVGIVRDAMEEMIDGVGVSVRSQVGKPYKGSGYVSIIGRQIIISNYEVFSQACKLAAIVDVCPRTDGTVELDFTFHGLAKRR